MQIIKPSRITTKPLLLHFSVLFTTLIFVVNILGQDVQFTRNNNSTVNVASDIDPSSLGLAINIQLANYPGRSGTDMPINLKYSSKVWNILYDSSEELPSEPGRIYTSARANYENGWSSNLESPRFVYDSMGSYFDGDGNAIDIIELYYKDGTPKYESYVYVPRLAIKMPDGSIHELRKGDWGYWKYVANPNPIPEWVSNGIYYAVDGSQIKYDTSNGTLYLPDGGRYISDVYNGFFTGNFLTYIDRNGNTINYSVQDGGWKDTVGRAISIPSLMSETVQDIGYIVKGIDNSNLSYTFRWKRLSDVRTDPNQPLRYAGDQQSPFYPTTYYSPSLFISDDTCVCNWSGDVFNPVVLNEIVLPNGTFYKFNYNVWGEIDKITYPSGGYERFRYDQVAGTSYVSSPYSQANRGVVEKWVSKDGNISSEVAWQYTNQPVTPTTGSYQYVTVVAPDNTKTERLFHSAGYVGPQFGFEDPKIGLLAEERVYDSTGGMVRRRLKDYEFSGPSADQMPSSGAGVFPFAKRNARPIKESEVILDTGSSTSLVTTNTFTYDSNLNVSMIREYGFAEINNRSTAETGAINTLSIGALNKTITYGYLSSSAYSRFKGLVNFMQTTDGNGNILDKSEMFYDETSLQVYGGQTIGWTDPSTLARGNLTTMRRWVNQTNYVDVHSTYDMYGNALSISDGLDHVSTMEYSLSSNYSYQTKIITPPADPSGVTGSNQPSQILINYDLWTGKKLSETDANNVTTVYEYNDPLQRLKKVTRADGSLTLFNYGDNPNNLYINTIANQDSTTNIEKFEYFDGLGRLFRKSDNEGDAWRITDYEYDNHGRLWRSSNPYRNLTPNGVYSSQIWTLKEFDALDRVIKATSPDGQNLFTTYSGNSVTVTDQANKKRKSVADYSGNITQVIEAPDSPNPYVTNYTYDANGNLKSVTQVDGEGVTQKRYFMHDWLGRLTRQKQPEENINSNLTIFDTVTGNSDWSMSFEYDQNDNVRVQKDARNVTISYLYDALNRQTQRSYNTPSGVVATPTTTLYYDGVGISGGVLFSKGKLTKVSSSVSVLLINEFDNMGRIKNTIQEVDGQSYPMSYGYDFAGHIISQTYPSGRIVKNKFDQAARIKEISGQATGQAYEKLYASQITYTPNWSMSSMKLGNNLREQAEFNDNLQKIKIKLGASLGDSSRFKLENAYSTPQTGNNGNLQQQQITAGGQTITQTYSFDEYDRLKEVVENSGNSWRQKYLYDRFGNRKIDTSNTTVSLVGINPDTNTADNRLVDYIHDATGNIETDPQGRVYKYDAVKLIRDVDNGASQYFYDGTGRRVKKLVDGIVSHFVYNLAGQMVAEYTTDSPSQEGTRYLTSDHTGTPRVITNDLGQVEERHDYLPFGEEIAASFGGRSEIEGYSAASNIAHKFTGKERDEETGLDFFGARYYASTIGRFTSPDPLQASGIITDPQTWNRYAYVSNNPMKYIDIGGFLKKQKNGSYVKREADRFDPANSQSQKKRLEDGTTKTFTWRKVFVETDSGNEVTAWVNNSSGDNAVLGDTDCHGLTFAEGEVWINNEEVPQILKDDGYTDVTSSPAQVGDVVVYYDAETDKSGNIKTNSDGSVKGKVVHSTTVTAVDVSGNVTEVSGLGGVQAASRQSTAASGFEPAARGTQREIRTFRSSNRTDEEKKNNAAAAKNYNKAAAKNDREAKKKEEKERKKREKEEKKNAPRGPVGAGGSSGRHEVDWQPGA